jgi:hypothetical protein
MTRVHLVLIRPHTIHHWHWRLVCTLACSGRLRTHNYGLRFLLGIEGHAGLDWHLHKQYSRRRRMWSLARTYMQWQYISVVPMHLHESITTGDVDVASLDLPGSCETLRGRYSRTRPGREHPWSGQDTAASSWGHREAAEGTDATSTFESSVYSGRSIWLLNTNMRRNNTKLGARRICNGVQLAHFAEVTLRKHICSRGGEQITFGASLFGNPDTAEATRHSRWMALLYVDQRHSRWM